MVKLKGYPLLNNINMLYFIFILAIINIGGFMYIQDNQSIFLFACISIIIYFFNKNMIIVLLSTMIIVNLLIFLNKLNGPIEGYEDEIEPLINEDEIEPLTEEDKELIDETQDNPVGELSELNDDNEVNNIKEKIKKILPILKSTYNNMDLNNINKHINNLTSILE